MMTLEQFTKYVTNMRNIYIELDKIYDIFKVELCESPIVQSAFANEDLLFDCVFGSIDPEHFEKKSDVFYEWIYNDLGFNAADKSPELPKEEIEEMYNYLIGK